MIRLMVNGASRETDAGTLESLFMALDLNPSLLLVEYNGKALLRSEWGDVLLAEGDNLELMSISAGG